MFTTNSHILVFVGGLHRSGTTPFVRLLGTSANVSIFRNTGAIEDEGQFLQNIFPQDKDFGGPGRFAMAPNAHLTEESSLVSAARVRLLEQWSSYWDMSKRILVEKTPAHIIQSRFLQAVFPEAYFLFVVRHPIPTCLATAKWCGAYLEDILTHYIRAHEILLSDLRHLTRAHVVFYEDLVRQPLAVVEQTALFFGEPLACDLSFIHSGRSARYFRSFVTGNYHLGRRSMLRRIPKRLYQAMTCPIIVGRFERAIRRLGYSFFSPVPIKPNRFAPWDVLKRKSFQC